MKKSQWVSSTEASKIIGVSEKKLSEWREYGYLKAGTHWRSAPNNYLIRLSKKAKPWDPEVIYHIQWCKEEIEYWRAKDSKLLDKAA